jgi:hypothetical protein
VSDPIERWTHPRLTNGSVREGTPALWEILLRGGTPVPATSSGKTVLYPGSGLPGCMCSSESCEFESRGARVAEKTRRPAALIGV